MNYKTRVIVFNQEMYDGEWPPTNLIEFNEWMLAKTNSIPEEYRDTANIEFDSVDGYEGTHYAKIIISYLRPEDECERMVREEKEALNSKNMELRERQQLSDLLRKYRT